MIMNCNRDLTVSTQNRFATLGERDMDESTILQSEGINRHTFEDSTVDSKLVHNFDELRFIRNEQVSCSRSLLTLPGGPVQTE